MTKPDRRWWSAPPMIAKYGAGRGNWAPSLPPCEYVNFEQNTLPLEIVFQDGRGMSPAEAKYPESLAEPIGR